MKSFLLQLRDMLVSLRLTVVLLVFSMLLVFAATLDQVNLGIWAVQQKYFQSFIIYAPIGRMVIPIFPGGYLIGGLLLANLVGAHVYRFKFLWRKTGIQLMHAGLILLLVGELLSGLWQQDYHMRLGEGETKSYAESFRGNELVFIDVTDPTFDDVVAIPEARLADKAAIQHPKLPFRVVPKSYYPNSFLQARSTAAGEPGALVQANAGLGETIVAVPQPVTHAPKETNSPTAIVELIGPDGTLGVYLASTQLAMPQQFSVGGRTWKLAMRSQRAYYPFSLTLLKFSHDRYPGTDIPKNFSSRLHLKTPDGRDDRDVLIFMNNPLRYAGLTFYQAGFENNERTTILQVVRNPSWILPYVASAMMSLGLIIQFCIHLIGFVRKPRPAPVSASPARTESGAPQRKAQGISVA